MSPNYLHSFVIGFFVFNSINCDKNVEIKLINDYLKKQIEPNFVTAFLCWRKDDLFKLQLNFFESDFLSIIHKPTIEKNFHIPHKNPNLIILDSSCEGSRSILNKANSMDMFKIEFHWLIFTDDPEMFKSLDVMVDSRVVIAEKVGQYSYDLSYVYKIGTERNGLNFNRIATWEYFKGFSSYDNGIISWKRHDLMKQTLRTSFVIQFNETYDHLDDYRNTHIDTQLKINYKFITYLAEYLNASFDIKFDRAWGEYIGNNTYTGVLGRIHRKEVDIGGSSLFCIKERLAFYDCIVTTIPVNGFFVFRQPPLSYVANIFVLPFGGSLWVINLLFLAICIVLIYAVVVWEWNMIMKTNEKPDIDMISPSLPEAVLFTMGAVCQQGYATEPKSSSGRIISITLFIAVIFLFTAYSANTVVLFQSTASHINTLQDLYDSKMPMGVKDELYLRFWFKNTGLPGSIRKKIYVDRIAPSGKKPNYYHLEEGVSKMREGYFAFFIDPISGYKVISDTFLEHEKCGLREITYLYVNNPMVTAPKNTSYRELYYVSFRIMKERGIFKREMLKIFASKPQCISQRGSFRTAGFLDLYAVYMIFFFGLAGSLIVLTLEIIHKKITDKYIHLKMLQAGMKLH